MKNIADQLTLAGASITSNKLVVHTLNGLDTEYNAIVVKLLDHTDLSWVDFQAHLLAFKSRLDQLSQFSSLTIEPSANIA